VAQQGQSRGRKVLWLGAAVALLIVAIVVGYRYGITLWDWIKILIVPAALAIGATWLTWVQRKREREAEAEQERERLAQTEQREREREATEEARRDRELRIERQRAQDATLQEYFDQTTQLLRGKDISFKDWVYFGAEERSLVRARTRAVLRKLDGKHKGSILQFLKESELITRYRTDLDLLDEVDLSEASLSGADLYNTDLSDANLSGADLREADLMKADLTGTNLSNANLSNADLREANLWQTDLRNADLSNANLSNANLFDAYGYTQEQLAQAQSLEGAAMPNGQKYEDWLKSKDRGEDGDSNGPS
jgi:hypothetical protein